MDRRIWLCLIFLLALSLRLNTVWPEHSFSGDQAYYTLRQVEHIRETGFPLQNDPLSSAASAYALPLFPYVLAFFTFFMPIVMVCKLIPNIFASSAVFLVYLLVMQGTKNHRAALGAAFVSALMPSFFSVTISSISPLSLAVPLALLIFYFLNKINVSKNPNYYVLVLCLFLVLDSSLTIIIVALVLYLLLLTSQNVAIGRAEKEIILFSVFLASWFYIVFFKELFVIHGPGLIRMNLPGQLFAQYFPDLNALQAVYLLGFVPVIGALYVLLAYIFRMTKKSIYLYAALAFSSSLMVWQHLVPLEIGLAYLGIALALLFGDFLAMVSAYVEKSRFANYNLPIFLFILAIFIVTSSGAALAYARGEMSESPGDLVVVGIRNLATLSDEGDLVAANPEESRLIQYFAGRRTVMDSNYIGFRDMEGRYRDLRLLYTSAIYPSDVYERYSIDWLVISRKGLLFYGVTRVSYITPDCFRKKYDNGEIQIFEHVCGDE
jgi:hypothetical protein